MDFCWNKAMQLALEHATKIFASLIGHITYTQAPVVHEKDIFHSFCFTQPVKNYLEKL